LGHPILWQSAGPFLFAFFSDAPSPNENLSLPQNADGRVKKLQERVPLLGVFFQGQKKKVPPIAAGEMGPPSGENLFSTASFSVRPHRDRKKPAPRTGFKERPGKKIKILGDPRQAARPSIIRPPGPPWGAIFSKIKNLIPAAPQISTPRPIRPR